MSRLWDNYDGEPFLENPHRLGILFNPHKKGRRKTMARRRQRRSTTSRRRRTYSRRRKTYRRNPPRRRYSARRRVTRRRSTRRRYQRNPKLFGGLGLPSMTDFLYTGAGFAAAPAVEGFVAQFVPANWTETTLGRYALKIGTVLGTSFLVKQVIGASEARKVLLGGSIYVGLSAVKDFAPGVIPGLGAYVPMPGRVQMGAYTGYKNLGQNVRQFRRPGMGAYAIGGQVARSGGTMSRPATSASRFASRY